MQQSLEESMARARRIRLMVFDVDGVLTDGSLHFGADGEMIKTFNVLDGHGIKLLQRSGIITAIISARQSALVTRRAADLIRRTERRATEPRDRLPEAAE